MLQAVWYGNAIDWNSKHNAKHEMQIETLQTFDDLMKSISNFGAGSLVSLMTNRITCITLCIVLRATKLIIIFRWSIIWVLNCYISFIFFSCDFVFFPLPMFQVLFVISIEMPTNIFFALYFLICGRFHICTKLRGKVECYYFLNMTSILPRKQFLSLFF